MTTKVIFNADPKIKAKAMANAKKQGVTLSYFLNYALAELAEGDKKASVTKTLNEKTRKEIDRALEDFKAGKNISPAFTSLEEGFAWLDVK